MGDVASDRRVLSTVGAWRATPDNYSSLRVLRFNRNWVGELVYAYGQTIYAVVRCSWRLPTHGRLRLTYAAVPRGAMARSFVLGDHNRVKELGYTLSQCRVAGAQDVAPNPYEFDTELVLSEPPWPSGLDLPYEVPRVFYGRRPAAAGPEEKGRRGC